MPPMVVSKKFRLTVTLSPVPPTVTAGLRPRWPNVFRSTVTRVASVSATVP